MGRFTIGLLIVFYGFSALPGDFDKKNFLDLVYSEGKPNKVSFGDQLKIQVENSSSPLFYRVEKKITRIEIEGKISPAPPPHLNSEDAYFSVGLVYPGGIRPNYFKRLFIPDWILQIFALGPKKGISNIDFYDVTPKGEPIDYVKSLAGIPVKRKSITSFREDGSFLMSIEVEDKDVLGLWLRSEGNDTKVDFNIVLDKISIK